MNDVGVIAIGRNEGDRLRLCLESALATGSIVIYVDSASTDGSAALARGLGAHVVDLDMSIPFSAARARNEGFALLEKLAPDVKLVQFVDGDCELLPGWIETARDELKGSGVFSNCKGRSASELPVGPARSPSSIAAVCGRRRERFPERSIYNRIADIEWNTPIGPAKSCGGDAMFRVDAFKTVGGFDPTVVAGEEPELCQRLRAAGWGILRIDADMTLHDSAMTKFGQWWKRSIRSGYGAADVASRFGHSGLFLAQVRSAKMWVYGGPIASVVLAIVALALFGPRWALAAMAIGATALPLQMLRTARGIRPRATSWPHALAYGVLTMLGKWANVSGQRQWAKDCRVGRYARMIEYKSPVPSPGTPGEG